MEGVLVDRAGVVEVAVVGVELLAVIGEEDDQGVLQPAGRLEAVEERPHMIVAPQDGGVVEGVQVGDVAAVEPLPLGHHRVEPPVLGPQLPLVAGVEELPRRVPPVVVGGVGAEEVHPEEEGGASFRSGRRGRRRGRPVEGAADGLAVLTGAAGEVVPALVVGLAHVREEGRGVIARPVEELGEGGEVVGEAVAVLGDPVGARIEPGQDRGERGPGGGPLRHRPVEPDAGGEEGVHPRARRLARPVAVGPQVVGAERVDREQQHVPPPGRPGEPPMFRARLSLPSVLSFQAPVLSPRPAAEQEGGDQEEGGEETGAHRGRDCSP